VFHSGPVLEILNDSTAGPSAATLEDKFRKMEVKKTCFVQSFLIFRRFAMFAVRFLRIYTTLCHSVIRMVWYEQQMISRRHEGSYPRLQHPEFKTASEAPYKDHIRVSQLICLQTRYLYRQFVCSVLKHHFVVFDVSVSATSFPRSARQKV
jgi:hypothetical protein